MCRFGECGVLCRRPNHAAVSDKAVQTRAGLIVVNDPIGLNNDSGAARDERAKWIPGRGSLVFRIEAPNAKQLAESAFRRVCGSPNLGSATGNVTSFVGGLDPRDCDYIVQGIGPHRVSISVVVPMQ